MNKTEIITFDSLPTSVDELKAVADMSTPFKTAALSVLAFLEYENNPEEAIEMINFLKGPQPLSNLDKQFIRDRLYEKGYVIRSYFEGTSPENDYTIPEAPYRIEVSDNPYSYTNEHYATLYLKSSGADSLRQITLRETADGNWCLWQHTFLSDIRVPKSQNPWA